MSAGGLSILVRVLHKLLGGYISLFASLAQDTAQLFGIEPPRLPWEVPTASIDQRLAKLEVAKAALMESLLAVQELQHQAETGKVEYDRVRAELALTIASKGDAERKLQSIQALMAQDVEAFQTLAGVPNVARERILGFASGVVASIIATGVVAAIAWVWKKFAG